MTRQKDLEMKGYEFLISKKYDMAERLLLQALDAKDDNPVDRHFVYNHLIDLYYKMRDVRKDALEKCVLFCRADIERLPTFLHQYRDVEGESAPDCPSVERLAIILEKHGELQGAIELCKRAIELGLDVRWDWYNAQYGTNKGYKARIQKLEKKMTSQKREGAKK